MASIEQATALAGEKRFREAIAMLDELALDPGQRLHALGHRAWLLRVCGDYEQSLRDYDELITADSSDVEARRIRAEVRLLLGDAPQAARDAIDLLQQDPLDRLALEILNRAQLALADQAVPARQASPECLEPVRAFNPVLEALERDPGSYPATVFPEIGRMLYSFVRMVRPRTIVEAGSYVGYSTLCMAQALEDNGGGHVHAYDIFVRLKDYVSPVIGPCEDLLQVMRAHIQAANLNHRVTLHKGDSATNIISTFEHTPGSVDMAFVDGDHRLRGCLRDWNVVDEILAPGGFVLLHDIDARKSGWLGPNFLLEELTRVGGSHYQSIRIPSPEGLGLAVIQKCDAGLRKEWQVGLWDTVGEQYWEQMMGRKPYPLALQIARWFAGRVKPLRTDTQD